MVCEEHLGTAYGTMQSVQNLGLALANIFIGYTIDQMGYFAALNVFLVFLASKSFAGDINGCHRSNAFHQKASICVAVVLAHRLRTTV